jgi:hypothetical protein
VRVGVACGKPRLVALPPDGGRSLDKQDEEVAFRVMLDLVLDATEPSKTRR